LLYTVLGKPIYYGQDTFILPYTLPNIPPDSSVCQAMSRRVCQTSWLPFHPSQRIFGLREPEGHRHVAVQVDGGSQGGTRLLLLAGPGVQRPEAAVAVGLKRAH